DGFRGDYPDRRCKRHLLSGCICRRRIVNSTVDALPLCFYNEFMGAVSYQNVFLTLLVRRASRHYSNNFTLYASCLFGLESHCRWTILGILPICTSKVGSKSHFSPEPTDIRG